MSNSKTRVDMPTLPAEERAHSFAEVATGYTFEMAVSEAERCLGCKNAPCVSGCPVGVQIPDFIRAIKEGDVDRAYSIITETSSLPAVCGRVCPQETQCEARCVRGIKGVSVAIGRLERYCADNHTETPAVSAVRSDAPMVAVVGSGPSGLSCAGELASFGYRVTVFEALHLAGGVLVYGIPEFRLPKDVVRREIDRLTKLGVTIQTNTVIGKTLTVDELMEMGYSAVFIGSGAGLPSFMNIPGEGLSGVLSANELLTRVNLMGAHSPECSTPVPRGGRVAVIGGGNVAMDAARTALRLGADEVYIVYRRSMDELPARREEIDHAIEEGVKFMLLTAPTEVLGYPEGHPRRGFVSGLKCQKMMLGEPDSRGRATPVPIPDSEFDLSLDTVVMAIGTSPNPLIKMTTPSLEVNKRGGIVTDEGGATSRCGVFAGGDAVTGAATVISAMGAGKRAAQEIHKYLSNNN